MMKPWMGHEWGFKKVEKLLEWITEFKFIKELTLYAFSMQNFNRPKNEFKHLMEIFNGMCDRFLDDSRLMKNKIRINFIGRTHLLPVDLQEKMKKLFEKTKNNKRYIINIALAYGGREEVIDAIKKMIKNREIDEINEKNFAKNLYTKSEPDIIIRTGGDKRTSNFMIWQSAYSEWFFIEKTWPEFEKEDLIKIIKEYKLRERRFGK